MSYLFTFALRFFSHMYYYRAEHVVRGLVEIFWECLQVSVGETGHARGDVLFVRLDGAEVVVIGWWLSKDFLET